MELLLLITICLLTGQTLGNDPVKMIFKAGDQDVLLSCSFKADLRDKKVKWIKDGKEIYVFGNGKVDPTKVDEHFRGRISHFQDGLQSGNASIKITKAKISDIGIYSCLFYDGVAQGGLWEIELTVGYVGISEGEDAILPCHHGRDLTHKKFDWKKDGTSVLLYDNTRVTTDELLKGRLSHFPHELQSGNASIKIEKAKVSDSGNYTCIRINERDEKEPELHIKLVVACKLNTRSEEDCVACRKPNIRTTKVKDGVQVNCTARGVSPKSKMELKNSAGDTVDAKDSTDDDITLLAVMTKEDLYHCVLTQEEICHKHETEPIFVPSVACRKPNIRTTKVKDGVQVNCTARGVSPKSKMELKNSAGDTVYAKEPTDDDITLLAVMTKEDLYHCVLTQEEICHKHETEPIFVPSGAGYFLVPSSLLVFSLSLSLGF